MTTVAILAPIHFDATPEQRARAERAAMQQMMLIARGHSVDSLEVRCAAELVGSALAGDPLEFELAAPPEPETEAPVVPSPVKADEPAWKRSASYDSYMRTIMSRAA